MVGTEERRPPSPCSSIAFDVLSTPDQNLEYQHNLDRLPIAVVVLIAPSKYRTASSAVIATARSLPFNLSVNRTRRCEARTLVGILPARRLP